MPAVLDASAVLALILNEPGASAVEPYVGTGLLSVVNYSEVVARLSDRGAPAELIRTQIDVLEMTLVGFDQQIAFVAGLLREATKHHGLSFADRACLATAAHLGVPTMTADQEWAELDIGVEVALIR